MHLPAGGVDIHQKNFAIARLREGSCHAGRERRCTGAFFETSYSDEFRFMGNTLQLEVKSKAVSDCFRITSNKMSGVTRHPTWLIAIGHTVTMLMAFFPWKAGPAIHGAVVNCDHDRCSQWH